MAAEPKERRKIYQQRKERGYCPRCKAVVKKSSKFIYCEDCRSFFRDYNRKNAEDLNKTRQELYQQRKENNCCPRCGKRLGKRYKNTICPNCLAKQYEYNKAASKKPGKASKSSPKTSSRRSVAKS